MQIDLFSANLTSKFNVSTVIQKISSVRSSIIYNPLTKTPTMTSEIVT